MPTASENAPGDAIVISAVSYRYGERLAVDELSLTIRTGEIFALVGPNGSGKTTLFRVLATLIPGQQGQVTILGSDIATQATAVRGKLGVVFQAASLDKKLTVAENIKHQGRLYGLSRAEIAERSSELLDRVGLADRTGDRVETLSGGLQRRVELAKAMLHRPQLLLLDEPSTGLDPGARADLWQYLRQLREHSATTILLTTHLLEEAERADRVAILHRGQLAALDTPDALRASIGGDSITIGTPRPGELAVKIREKFSTAATVLDGAIRLEQPEGHTWISKLVAAFPEEIESITLGKPTLEDVFIHRTGHRFMDEEE